MLKISILIISFILFLLALSLLGFYLAIRPIKITSAITPAAFNIPYENITFRTKDNVLISGWFIPHKNPKAKTIILLHGYPADKGDIVSSRIFLHQDYNLLFFDFRYLGQSEGKYSSLGFQEVFDLLAAIDYLRSRGIKEVGIWGFSLGGAVALMTAAQAPEIKAMVIESAYARLDWLAEEYYRLPILRYALNILTQWWGRLFLNLDIKTISPAISARDIKIPLLFIYSKDDHVISFRHALLVQENLKSNPQAEFIFEENLLHGQPIKNQQAIVQQFFAKHLK